MTPQFSRSTRLLTAVVVGVAGAACLAAGAAQAAPSRTTLTDTVPHWLGHATPAATAASAQPEPASQSVRVYLQPNGGTAALQAAVAAVSTPGSTSYGKYLSEPQFTARYAPTAAQAAAVTSYLRSQGLSVDGVEAHRRYVSATGTRSQLNAAFGVSLQAFSHDGQTVVAPTSAASVPSSLASAVLTVTGLDTTVQTMSPDHLDAAATPATAAGNTKADSATQSQADAGVARPAVQPPAASAVGHPCSVFYDVLKAKYQADMTTPLPEFQGSYLSYASCGYTPPQLYSSLSGVPAIHVGSGQTVGIVDAYTSKTIVADTNRLASDYGWPTLADGQYTAWMPSKFTHQATCQASSWTTEQTLDVQAVHTMRPDAAIRYYAAADCITGLQDALAAVVDENRVDVVSNSWGGLEPLTGINDIRAYEQIFLQGAMQGQTFLFSSGDYGDNVKNTGYRSVNYPSSDPYVTSVGGTSLGIVASPLGISKVGTEAGWGTATAPLSDDGKSWQTPQFAYGAGGGRSTVFPEPDWQVAVVPQAQTTGRAVPDVASLADPNTGMLVGQTLSFTSDVHYGEFRIGGTSLAAPLVTGKILQANEDAGRRLGFANPTLYATSAAGFADILPTSVKGVVNAYYLNGVNAGLGIGYAVRTWGQDSSLTVTKGWDTVTGRGRPGDDFATQVAAVTGAARR